MKFETIPDGQWYIVRPTPIEAAMSGCRAAAQKQNGSITLEYADGTTEEATFANPPQLDELAKNWFCLVETVQTLARKGGRT